MNFADLKSLTIPEGTVTKITVGSTVLWQAISEYTVTQYLSECTSNNSATKVTGGSSYTATLTADSGLYLYVQNVSVTMGGRDITASAYNASTKKITISKVTGNIVITAEATERNYIAESTDDSGAIFNGCGYGEEDGYYATGFIPISRYDIAYFDSMEFYEGDKLVFYNSSYTELATITVDFSESYERFGNDNEYVTSYYHNYPYTDSGTKPVILASGVYFRVFCQYIDEYSSITIGSN